MGFNLLGGNARRLYHDIWRDPDLVGLWLLNEGSSVVYDHALTYRANGTVASSPTYGATAAPGFPGMTFVAANSHYVGMGHQNQLDFASGSTFAALAVVTLNSNTVVQMLAGTYISDSTGPLQGWTWAVGASGQQQALFGQGASVIYRVSCTTNATGTPLMLGLSFSPADAGTATVGEPEDFTFYRNGVGSTVGVNGASAAIGVTTSTNEFRIGAAANSTYFFDGTIGFVAVFSGGKKTAVDFKRWAGLGGFR